MILTKHCEPRVREFMLNGHFKFGTHQSFAQGNTAAGRLSDRREGHAGDYVPGSVKNMSFSIPSQDIIVENMNTESCGYSVAIESTINAYLFCTSYGPYDATRHRRIVHGASGYAPNKDCTAFLEIDEQRLMKAVEMLAKYKFGTRFRLLGRRVVYGDRDEKYEQAEFPSVVHRKHEMQRLLRAAFWKPRSYRVEDEYRVLLATDQVVGDIFTNTMPSDIVNVFAEAIHNPGSIVF